MGLEVHLLLETPDEDGQPKRRAVLPFSTAVDAYFAAPSYTETAWLDVVDEHELDDDLREEGLAILRGGDPSSPYGVVDMDRFSRLYQQLYAAVGFVGCPAAGGPWRASADDLRVLTTGIRFLREFYDGGDQCVGTTGHDFVRA